MWENKVRAELEKRRKRTLDAGGANRIEKQHQKGKLTARERIEYLFDENSFTEIYSLVESRGIQPEENEKKIYGDGVITGYGTINGRMVFSAAQDFTVVGGTLGESHSKKICKTIEMAIKKKAPFISINDSGGARIEEGIQSLNGYSKIFKLNTKASGIIPQISVILGPCAGGACYSPAITDFIFLAKKTSYMFITGPDVVNSVIGESIGSEELGGERVHISKSGVAHFSYNSDEECLDGVKKLLSFLPQNCYELAIKAETKAPSKMNLEEVVPDNQRKTYDIHEVITRIIDENSFFEVQTEFAKNIVIGFARLDGESIGIVANNPHFLGGSLDIDASEKVSRFVRFCDSFNIPILTLVDVPGFFPGSKQEHNGIIRKGAKLLYAYAESSVPKVTLIIRKAFGGAYIAMSSKGLGADVVFAWPIAQTAVMGAEGAVRILYKKSISNMNSEEIEKLSREYEEQYMNPYEAAQKGYIDEVILPEETRTRLIRAFRMLKIKDYDLINKPHHGNIPL